jgi:hypothetical protein
MTILERLEILEKELEDTRRLIPPMQQEIKMLKDMVGDFGYKACEAEENMAHDLG